MGSRLRIFLNPEEDRTLFEMRTATTIPQRVKDRAEAIRLNAQGWYVEQIAAHLNWHPQTVREALHRWQKYGLGGLWDAPGRGARRRWQPEDLDYLELHVQKFPDDNNCKVLAQRLAQDRQVHLSPDQVRRILKKRAQ